MRVLIQGKILSSFLLILLYCALFSCTSSRQVIYLNDLKDTTAKSNINQAQTEFQNLIQKNDQIAITVGGSNPLDLPILNSGNAVVSVAGGLPAGGVTGYLVEADGSIKIPYVGKLQAEGLTRLQLEDTLTQLFKEYTKNPIVNVRFLNYYFSVMGEVTIRGRFNMPNERITILEALSVAGDITEFGKRDNILVIREVNGKRNFARVSLLSKDLFNSPYYYLKTNDIVYVEPIKSKFIARKGVPQYLGLAAVGLSLLLTIINLRK
ncbi:polysaccharide biosynthesis/export family protein [Ferruginibacter paludis]|uniref:polysaccharide biosynthesis/export family protein n=1 Tax=Ferruginibacter paludis TaxID=1310417 RepID=UPI0025B3D703|nr:polysaccharide biosynthesis/export family protein [Ferruginibacter paludis]MDN3658913.1 polysaccharide biosynthesis/export family protein [Ferruginibacter paludis]